MQNRTGRGLLLIVALLTLTLTLAFAPAASARGGTNLVRNPGFEIDANLDSRPDDWTPSTPAFTRSAAVVKSGSYSGKYYLSAIGQSRVGQRINGITPGRMYVFNTGLNIDASPRTRFALNIEFQWKNAAGTTISTSIVSGGGETKSWIDKRGAVRAPARATSVQLVFHLRQLSSGNITVYIDDVSFSAS
jgi:hypothetical protein